MEMQVDYFNTGYVENASMKHDIIKMQLYFWFPILSLNTFSWAISTPGGKL